MLSYRQKDSTFSTLDSRLPDRGWTVSTADKDRCWHVLLIYGKTKREAKKKKKKRGTRCLELMKEPSTGGLPGPPTKQYQVFGCNLSAARNFPFTRLHTHTQAQLAEPWQTFLIPNTIEIIIGWLFFKN